MGIRTCKDLKVGDTIYGFQCDSKDVNLYIPRKAVIVAVDETSDPLKVDVALVSDNSLHSLYSDSSLAELFGEENSMFYANDDDFRTMLEEHIIDAESKLLTIKAYVSMLNSFKE